MQRSTRYGNHLGPTMGIISALYASFIHRICDYNSPTNNSICGLSLPICELYSTAPSFMRVINVVMLSEYANYQFNTSYANYQYDIQVIAAGYAYDLRRICEISREYAIRELSQRLMPIISARNIGSMGLIWALSAQYSNYHSRNMQFFCRICVFLSADMPIYGAIWKLTTWYASYLRLPTWNATYRWLYTIYQVDLHIFVKYANYHPDLHIFVEYANYQ